MAFDSANNSGKPARIVEGKLSPGAGEIIIDHSQSKKVSIGDTISAAEQKFKVVGFSEGGDVIDSSFAFVAKDEFNKIQDLAGKANYFLVSIKPGFAVNTVIDNIKSSIPGVDATTSRKFEIIQCYIQKNDPKPHMGNWLQHSRYSASSGRSL